MQLYFLKRLLHLPTYTLGCMFRLETEISHTLVAVLKRSTGFFKKIRELDPALHPHLCQQELIQLHNQSPNIKSN